MRQQIKELLFALLWGLFGSVLSLVLLCYAVIHGLGLFGAEQDWAQATYWLVFSHMMIWSVDSRLKRGDRNGR